MKILIALLVVLLVGLWLFQRSRAQGNNHVGQRTPQTGQPPAPGAEAPRPVQAPQDEAPTPDPVSREEAEAKLTPEIRAEVSRLLEAGDQIAAVKLVRLHTGVGLKRAKEITDDWQ